MPDLTNNFLELVLALLAGILTSLVAVPLCKPLGLIDFPGAAPHKQHARPTPLAGGLVIGMSLFILILIYPGLASGKMLGAIISSTIILIFGIWDDRSGLSAKIKFTGQFLAAGIAIYSGIRIEILSEAQIPGGLLPTQFLNGILTVFWLVGITNAFNLIDSMDGIVAGLSTLAGAFFIFVTSGSNQPELTIWAAVLTGISLALYFWNSPPARYFLGDSGAQTLGFLLAVLALLYNPVNKDQASSWFAPILILGVPIFDTSLVVFSRLRRHIPPFEGNRDHTYHRLVRAGMNSSRAVSLLHIIALSLDSIALFALSQHPLFANLIFASCLIIAAGLIYIFDFSSRFISLPKP
jgi:UDP-GlcNAc:undecaprenyl-phosphate/decaprenyl-phosphate GlcNAc-1-phosphate transferase